MDYDISQYARSQDVLVTSADAGILAAVGIGVTIAIFIAIFGVYILQSIFMMQLFKKAKVARWKAWVPFVNMWTFLKVGGQSGWWMLAGIGGAIIGYICFAAAGVTGVLGNTDSIGTGVAIGGLAVFGYLVMLAGLVLMAVFYIISAYNISKKLGFGGAMVVVFIFFELIWFGIAGLSKAKFDDKKGKPNLAKTV